jgi:hypothetical protein
MVVHEELLEGSGVGAVRILRLISGKVIRM